MPALLNATSDSLHLYTSQRKTLRVFTSTMSSFLRRDCIMKQNNYRKLHMRSWTEVKHTSIRYCATVVKPVTTSSHVSNVALWNTHSSSSSHNGSCMTFCNIKLRCRSWVPIYYVYTMQGVFTLYTCGSLWLMLANSWAAFLHLVDRTSNTSKFTFWGLYTFHVWHHTILISRVPTNKKN